MILNRPGCELLDTLLRDVAFILQSYGIQVRLSLLEQSELDAEGGISSYLQRNIDTCDYILIMFTEYSEGMYVKITLQRVVLKSFQHYTILFKAKPKSPGLM